ncbi:glycosyltransferase family A protein [Chlorogloeopsis sp. ULAP01]|uniref:glycosyltransferase n=1 Tax=Chlorogloeopsis sp. ULAP01 TaxID=3056483 RepID=UPI0025AB2100|nr:glycosyltransferase family A protein [Chlorogloeopsis sp. ULAP01]MDM9382270.1 glycosyltransferase family A protein [Chlorogloeopsis sp. ULAP01]
MPSFARKIGVVVIGRNEGDRLIRSLDSVVDTACAVVYVDSGSTDGSCEVASGCGVEVVNLDMSVPFTAARARNAGFERLREKYPQLEYVQFVDGDCEVIEGWMEAACETLDANPDIVAVCGWRRERYPQKSVYNRICDVEWRIGSVGNISNFGGDVMIRAVALAAVGGYNSSVIAAEDDELSVRLRQAKGKILRLDRESTWHDANMHTLSQWWQRAKRCGYGYAQVCSLHGEPPECKFVKEVRRALIWGAIAPLGALLLLPFTYGISLLIFGRYPLAALRTIYQTRQQGFLWADRVAWGLSCGVSVFPEAIGVFKFYRDRLTNKQFQIIEYKNSQTPVLKGNGEKGTGNRILEIGI